MVAKWIIAVFLIALKLSNCHKKHPENNFLNSGTCDLISISHYFQHIPILERIRSHVWCLATA